MLNTAFELRPPLPWWRWVPWPWRRGPIVVSQLSGQYDQVFTAISMDNFASEATFSAGAWFDNGRPVPSQRNAWGIFPPASYALYAKFVATGTSFWLAAP